MARQGTSRPSAGSGTDATAVLPYVFAALFSQFIALIAVSFIRQQGVVFVPQFFFGLDYADFYAAAADWWTGVDPYHRGRLYTPPSSLLVGLTFQWLAFPGARLAFFVLNIALVYWSIRTLARQLELTRSNERALLACAALFYPFYFLIERGNLDGIMLALLVFGFRSRSWLVKACAIGTSVAIKLYSGLILLVLLRKRRWTIVLASVMVGALLQLPFAGLLPNFLTAVATRSGLFRLDENISPAAIFRLALAGLGGDIWKAAFLFVWVVTLTIRAKNDAPDDLSDSWPAYVPWMISIPVVVYPYSGILSLALAAWVAAQTQRRRIALADLLALTGFGLLGVQAAAWTALVARDPVTTALIHSVCALGTLLMMIGTCWISSAAPSTEPHRPPPATQAIPA